MKNITLLFFAFILSSQLVGQEFPIPYIDWDAIQDSKPWEATEAHSPIPEPVTPGHLSFQAPSDAIILFDGSNLDAWHRPKYAYGADFGETEAITKNRVHENYVGTPPEWNIVDGTMEVKPGGGNLETKQAFGSVQLHLEWLSPVDPGKEGQAYSNSGVFFMGIYEVQVLNSYNNPTYPNGQAGAVYKQHIPLVNASRPPGQWQTYDIIFNAPEFKSDGSLKTAATITVLHNGVLIQNNVTVKGPTMYIGEARYFPHPEKMPLILQDHSDKVKFRNIWIREL